MTVLIILAGLLLLFGSAIAIAWPLLHEEDVAEAVSDLGIVAEDPLLDLQERRDAVYKAIQELNFDHEVGKVSAADFQAFDGKLKAQAVGMLKEIDALEAARADPDLDARLESAIAALRRRGQPVAIAAKNGSAGSQFCPQCGQSAGPDDRFCGKCGASLAA